MARTVAATGAAIIEAPSAYVEPAGGTATCAVEWPLTDGAAQGEATLTGGALVSAHFARVRVNGVVVELDGVEVDNLVGGVKITRDLESPAALAEFVVAAPEVAHFHPSSISVGPVPCEIRFLTGEPGSIDEYVAFTGEAETSENDGPYRPVATFRAVDTVGSAWAKDRGCVREMAFSGRTRGALLVQLAAQLSIPLTNAADIALRGATVNKPVDFTGTILEFVDIFCEPEGWHLVERNGALELLESDKLLDGEPIIELDEETLYAAPERGPDQPQTRFALSGTRLTAEAVSGVGSVTKTVDGTPDETGAYQRTSVTTRGGVELIRRTEDYEVFAPDGDPPGISALRLARVEEIENTWIETSRSRPGGGFATSTQLSARVTKRYEYAGVRASDDNGSAFDWDEAEDRFTTAEADLLLVQEIRETFVWNDDTDPSIPSWKACTLVSSNAEVYAWYSPRVDPAAMGAHEYTADGSFRDATAYTFRLVETISQRWDDARAATPGWVGWVTMTEERTAFRAHRRAAAPNDTYWVDSAAPARSESVKRTWRPNESNSEYRLSEARTNFDPSFTGRRTTDKSEVFPGPCPGAPVGSANVPQIVQQPMLWSYDYSLEVGYPSVADEETNPHAENEDELAAIGRRRLRRALEVVYTLEARDYPGLREGDVVAFVSRARSLETPTKGYVRRIEILRDFGGLARAFLTVAVRTWGA